MILVIYRPPTGNINNFVTSLNISLENVNFANNDLIILGDMNIDMSNNKDPNASLLKNKLLRHNLTQYIKQPTRYNNTNKGSIIDLIFTNSSHVNQYGVESWNISDHELVYLTRKHQTKIKHKTSFVGRTYRNYVRNDYQAEIGNLEFNYFFTIKNSDLAWKHLLNKIEPVINRHCPFKTFKIKNVKDPWIMNELLEMIHDKDYFLAKAKKYGDLDDWRIARNVRNQTKVLVKNSKRTITRK